MKKIFFSLLLMFFCSFILFAQSSITKEEYVVYARVLRSIRSEDLKQSKTKYSFVVLDKTFKPEHFDKYKTGKFKSLSKDFWRKNLTPAKLERLFPVNYEYEIASRSKIDELLKIGEKELNRIEAEYKLFNIGIYDGSDYVWEPFHTKYSNAKGFYQFSRVGFSPNKKFALVLVEGKGADWSSNMEYILIKTRGKWRIYSSGGGFSIA